MADMASSLAGQFYQWKGAGEPPEEIGEEQLAAVKEVATQIIGQLKSSLTDEIAFKSGEVEVSLAASVEELTLPSESLAATVTFTRGEEEQPYQVTYILSGGGEAESEEAEAVEEPESVEETESKGEEEVAEEPESVEGAESEDEVEVAEESEPAGEEEVEEAAGELAEETASVETETAEAESEEGLPDLSGLFDTEPSSDDETAMVEISPAEFDEFDEVEGANGRGRKIDMLLDVELDVTVELGRKLMSIDEILRLGKGSVVELEKLAGEPVDILVNGKKLAEGEVVVVEDHFGVRLTHLLNPKERIKSLGG